MTRTDITFWICLGLGLLYLIIENPIQHSIWTATAILITVIGYPENR